MPHVKLTRALDFMQTTAVVSAKIEGISKIDLLRVGPDPANKLPSTPYSVEGCAAAPQIRPFSYRARSPTFAGRISIGQPS